VSRAKKIRKQLQKRGVAAERLLVICTGKKCAPREASRALVELAEGKVALQTLGCLHVCKKGPIAATVRGKKVRVKKRVGPEKLARMIEKLTR
jgi:NADH:ubiquinone oxidoreductase subunit E